METGKNLLTDIVGSGKYIIDAVGFYNLGKTACRIYMFSDDIDIYDPYSIMSYFVSLQTTSLYNNSVRDLLTLYSISYLDQYIDDNIIHDWPVKLPDPPPSINFYPIQINLSEISAYLRLNSQNLNPHWINKSYIIRKNLFDFGTFGITNWQTVLDNYDNFSFQISNAVGHFYPSKASKDPEHNYDWRKNILVNLSEITESGTNVFNNHEEWFVGNPYYGRGYELDTKIVFYRENMYLKLLISYTINMLYDLDGGYAEMTFINNPKIININLKEK
ncbi:MAG: hypothetical protein SPLM_00700 [Spiroplasma phoeniceum]